MKKYEYHAEQHYDGSHWFVERDYGDEALTVADELTEGQAMKLAEYLNNA